MRSPAKIEHGVRCCASRNVLKCHGCPYHGEPYCKERLLKDVQDYLKAIRKCGARIEQQVKRLEAARPKWISVEEPPKHTCDYLVYVWVACPDGVAHMQMRTGIYNIVRKEWTIPHDQSEVVGEPEYWMPLPEVPKEE